MTPRDEQGKTIDAYTMLVIQTTARETAAAAIAEHKSDCKINEIAKEWYGNDRPGAKMLLHEYGQRISRLERYSDAAAKGILGLIGRYWQIGLILLILLANLFAVGRRMTPQDIQQIAEQIRLMDEQGP